MRVELMFPSRYLKAADFGGKSVTNTIASVAMDELQMRGGKHETKPVITFSDAKKMLVMNKTNAMAIAELLGPETDNWTGKRITMFPTRDRMGGKMVDCIRIKGSPDAVKHDSDGVVVEDELPPEPEPAAREPGEEG
ncbi:MAG: hypothetical protein WC683_09310 [bacterium]|jgi:hypothetical protein